jgi:lipopolysaccharide export system protein LptA
MRSLTFQPCLLYAALISGLIFTGSIGAETVEDNIKKSATRPMVINSKTLEMDDVSKVVTFTGDVNAKTGDFIIDCQKMLVYYKNLSKNKKIIEDETKISKIVATGKVRISRSQGGLATAEKAVYFEDDEKIVLTGKPVVKQGNDFVEGDRITIFLKENRSVVESSIGKKVKAVIFPKSEKR